MNASVWTEYLAKIDYPASALPAAADTVIVGAGYTGLNAARELARRGQQVAVFDQGPLGAGASGLNFGSVALGVAASHSSIARRYGDAFARETAKLSQVVLDRFCRLVTEEQIDCDLQKNGHLTIALNRRQLQRLSQNKQNLDALIENELVLLSAADSKQFLDIDAAGGLLNRNSYSINPIKYLKGLVASAISAGVSIFENLPVSEIRSAGAQKFVTRCGDHTIRSKHVIVCTNGVPLRGFSPSYRGIVPINSYLIATEPLAASQLAAIGQPVFSTAHLLPNYFRLTRNKRLLFGSRKDIAARPSLERDTRELIARMNKLLPFTRGLKITHSWSGKLGFTFDRLPHVGVENGIHYAMGYCGKGIPWATYCGMAVANLVAGENTIESVISTRVIQPAFYRGHPWFRKPLSLYYRAMDAFI